MRAPRLLAAAVMGLFVMGVPAMPAAAAGVGAASACLLESSGCSDELGRNRGVLAARQPGVAPPAQGAPVAFAIAHAARNAPSGGSPYFWAGVALSAAGVVALGAGLALYVRGRRGRNEPAATPPAPAEPVFAFLELQDGSNERYPITSQVFRIGRHSKSDLKLSDPSVSRQHAEINRRGDGSFSIIDLDSMNGVFVNNRLRKQCDLSAGDVVELGDVVLRFTVKRASELSPEEASMFGADVTARDGRPTPSRA